MSVYECICCGATRESEEACSCLKCGYKMFETPYNRRDILFSEIDSFFSRLKMTRICKDDLLFVGKDKDDNRFPNYQSILRFVTDQNRTETFTKNLLKTIEQMKVHFSKPYYKEYPVSFENADGIINKYDKALCAAIEILVPGTTINIESAKWKKASLIYNETPDKNLWFSANELIDLIEKLTKKIVGFIKLNNLYGTGHQFRPIIKDVKNKQNTDYRNELENAISNTKAVLNKSYFVDIMDDGTLELQEMLICLWHDIELILRTPLFVKNYNYIIETADVITEEEMLQKCSKILSERYEAIDATVDIVSLLHSKTEEELFEIYKELIAVDKFGFLVPHGTTLINIGESERKLNVLIGLSTIKDSIQKIKAYAIANNGTEGLNLHMCFYGNPGTGKTEVARIIAGILYENKILPTNKVVEVDRGDLIGQYVGETPQKTKHQIETAMGGVLFIDEAYSLAPKDCGYDYGNEAVATLIKAMEDYRGKFCVILAGYRNQMHEMLSTNPGFKSRIQFELDFPNYSRDDLEQITKLMMSQRGYRASEEAVRKILDVTDTKRKDQNFANAREIRNILDQVIMCQNLRCNGSDDHEIGVVDVNHYIKDSRINLPTSDRSAEVKILTAEEELDQLIGLSSAKRMVKKIKAYAKRNKQESDFNLHMCFYGNPGTGKTEVARILSRILYDAGVLAEAKLVETDAHGLIGKYVGETAPKTEGKIRDAMGGVLFIDEAYGLTFESSGANGSSRSYGDEAIAVLLKEMEDYRGQFCAIFAGYQKEIQSMLGANPGLKSRIQFVLEFPDYTYDELGMIASVFIGNKGYIIADDALKKLLDVAEYYRNKPNFANARTVRNIVDQVIMNQNLRTENEEKPSPHIILSDVDDYINDESIDLTDIRRGKHKLGFG